MNISLSDFAPDNLVSRDGFGNPAPRQSAYLHNQAESGAYLRDSSRVPRRRPFIDLLKITVLRLYGKKISVGLDGLAFYISMVQLLL